MRRADYWMCCWPGLRGVWTDGDPLALACAAAFAMLLNLGLVSSFVWTEVLTPPIVRAAWVGTLAIWCGFAWRQYRQARHDAELPEFKPSEDALFIQAQAEYLKGHWDEAEWILRQRLSSAPRDVESRLLLLTLYRRLGRRDMACEHLKLLRRLDGAAGWTEEIDREARILESRDEPDSDPRETAARAESAAHSTGDAQTRMISTKSVRHAA